jgi:cell division protein FtsW
MTQVRNTYLCLVCVLLALGLLMVYSASITARPTEFEQVYVKRHVTFLVVALIAGGTAALLPAEVWRRAAPWLFGATVALLVAVLVPGVGHRVNGAQRWLRWGALSLQPSELAKVTLPLFVCWSLSRRETRGPEGNRRAGLRLLLPIGAVMLLVAKEPDLGTAVFLGLIAGLTLFAGGWPLRNFLLSGMAAIPAIAALVAMRPYQIQRITGYLAAWESIDQAPYQVKQSLLTLGVGGVSGVGLGRGWQKLSFLPEANTDFVFGVVGEELGLIGTLGLLGLWIGLFVTGLKLLSPLDRRSFAWVAGFSLLTQVVLQAALNVAVVTAMVPPKGIALPLLSYGGSSLLVSVLALGIVLGASRSVSAGPAGGLPDGAGCSIAAVGFGDEPLPEDRSSRVAKVA